MRSDGGAEGAPVHPGMDFEAGYGVLHGRWLVRHGALRAMRDDAESALRDDAGTPGGADTLRRTTRARRDDVIAAVDVLVAEGRAALSSRYGYSIGPRGGVDD